MTKRTANLTVDAAVLTDAKALGINLSATFESGLRAAVRQKKAEQWLEENRLALSSYNDWVGQNGLPLARYRQF